MILLSYYYHRRRLEGQKQAVAESSERSRGEGIHDREFVDVIYGTVLVSCAVQCVEPMSIDSLNDAPNF
jgi:hypothetical protein